MKIGIQIKNQNITTEKTRCIVANSVNFVTGVCSFDEEWDGLAKHIIFTNGDVSKELIITQGTDFVVPYEVLVPGELEISVVGYGEKGEKRLTTKKMSIPMLVYESGDITGDKSEGYTPEIWEQIAAVIGNIPDLAVDADTLVDAINSIVNAVNTDGVVLQKDDSGFYQTTEGNDGATTYYLHDKKSLEQSQNIIKLSDNMLEFSNDGGESYLYGLAVNNDVLPELLAKIENHTESFENPHNVTASQIGAVPKERKINGKTLKEDVVITAEELNAVPADRKINGKALSGDIMLDAKDFGAVPVSRKVNGKPLDEDIVLTATDVGAEISGTIQESIEKHNAAISAHRDIRTLVEALANDINTLSDTDDAALDRMAELADGIENNRELIDAVSAEKLNISDVVNDLVTVDANKPLSAAQGVTIKRLIDSVSEHTENNGNPHAVTIGQIGAAPAGYGLGLTGNYMPVIADCNTCFQNGFYNCAGSANTPLGKYGWMLVITGAYTRQDFFTSLSDPEHLVRHYVDGIWSPWEWVNPPMFIGVEYRTTERYMGKPVYAKLIDCGKFPSASTKEISVADMNIAQLVSCVGFTDYVGATLPTTAYSNGIAYNQVNVEATRYAIIVTCGLTFWTEYTCYVILKYTKS